MNSLSNTNSSHSYPHLNAYIASSDVEGLLNKMEALKANQKNPSMMSDAQNAYGIGEELRATQKALDIVREKIGSSQFESKKRGHNFSKTESAKVGLTARDKVETLLILFGLKN